MALCTAAVACGLACLLDARVRFFVLRTLCVAVYFLTLVSAENILFQNLFLNVANSFVVRSLCVAVFSPFFLTLVSAKKGTASKCVFQGSEPPFPKETKLKRCWLIGALRGAVPFFAQLRRAQILLPTLTPWGEGALRLKTCFHFGTFFRKHRYLILALRIHPSSNTFLNVTHGYREKVTKNCKIRRAEDELSMRFG